MGHLELDNSLCYEKMGIVRILLCTHKKIINFATCTCIYVGVRSTCILNMHLGLEFHSANNGDQVCMVLYNVHVFSVCIYDKMSSSDYISSMINIHFWRQL